LNISLEAYFNKPKIDFTQIILFKNIEIFVVRSRRPFLRPFVVHFNVQSLHGCSFDSIKAGPDLLRTKLFVHTSAWLAPNASESNLIYIRVVDRVEIIVFIQLFSGKLSIE